MTEHNAFENSLETSNPDAAGDFYASLSKVHSGAGRPTKAFHRISHNSLSGAAVATDGWVEHQDLGAWKPPVADESVDLHAKSTRDFVLSASPHSDTNLRNPGNEKYLGSGKSCSHAGCTLGGCTQ